MFYWIADNLFILSKLKVINQNQQKLQRLCGIFWYVLLLLMLLLLDFLAAALAAAALAAAALAAAPAGIAAWVSCLLWCSR